MIIIKQDPVKDPHKDHNKDHHKHQGVDGEEEVIQDFLYGINNKKRSEDFEGRVLVKEDKLVNMVSLGEMDSQPILLLVIDSGSLKMEEKKLPNDQHHLVGVSKGRERALANELQPG